MFLDKVVKRPKHVTLPACNPKHVFWYFVKSTGFGNVAVKSQSEHGISSGYLQVFQ